ncbi:hypothetical protein [Actinomadura sp. CNU-125]|uniref:hypothetical protein n=1 Tax=Actinomadura sp. CNU-125 TaxID=1904961 RepID=UPI002916725B|nr:hypothetical protein [Actinomadura sp. CNU-125]
MDDHLSQVSAAVPDLRPYTAAIRDVFARCAANARPLPFQRVHGDYHLGQAMRTGTGWVLLDFEGEPARTRGSGGRSGTRCGTSRGCCARSSTPRGTCRARRAATRPRRRPRPSSSGRGRGRSGTGRRSAAGTRRRAAPTRWRTPGCCGRWSWTRPCTRSGTRRATARPGCPSRCAPWTGSPVSGRRAAATGPRSPVRGRWRSRGRRGRRAARCRGRPPSRPRPTAAGG